MVDVSLLHHLMSRSAQRWPHAVALSDGAVTVSYGELMQQVEQAASGLRGLGLQRAQRVGIWLEKRVETVVASFATPMAGGVIVPINPLLKPDQIGHIIRDCEVSVLITSPERLGLLEPVLQACPSVAAVVVTSAAGSSTGHPAGGGPSCRVHLSWGELQAHPARQGHRLIDTDVLAILYTSGSTGRPKGVVLSHRNMVAGAQSVASYLGNTSEDVILAALPLSFDAGFSQLTTGFLVGARVVLLNMLMPRDVLRAMEREKVTGLTAVPPLYLQLAALDRWPESIAQHLRYFANTGGRMPLQTLQTLRQRLPRSRPFLMYGLTEAFRSTYLPPEEIDRRPDSIGKAIPNAEILVLREDGTECAPDEPGELVHRGPLVGLGYWGDPVKTAERYRPLPAGVAAREKALVMPEMAVWSGDTVRRDAEGFLYFVGRRDEMIKSSGYRISPTEVEEVLYATGLVGECAAFGVEHAQLGQVVEAVVSPEGDREVDVPALLSLCRQRMPAYMVPAAIHVQAGPLPRNPNGKIDRKALAATQEAR